eukprot:COSAG05_NODE_20236_length_281_cov_0.840659_1_plen_31_part_10
MHAVGSSSRGPVEAVCRRTMCVELIGRSEPC